MIYGREFIMIIENILGIFLIEFLFFLGERLTDPETEEVLADCMGQEDDDGYIPYERKYLFFN